MKTLEIIKILVVSFLFIVSINGCGGSSVPCSLEDIRSGTFCYDGHDFGKNPDPNYRQGVRDGCKTGKGHFVKDYTISDISLQYRQGWIKGRAICRPKNWSDHPTYSYHPLPDSEKNTSIDANNKNKIDNSYKDNQNNSDYNDDYSDIDNDTEEGDVLFGF